MKKSREKVWKSAGKNSSTGILIDHLLSVANKYKIDQGILKHFCDKRKQYNWFKAYSTTQMNNLMKRSEELKSDDISKLVNIAREVGKLEGEMEVREANLNSLTNLIANRVMMLIILEKINDKKQPLSNQESA